jgi:sensor histidine kinase YesM
MLSASQRPWHPLSAEFQRVEDYLALMQIRMGPRLRPHLSLPDALAALPVPPLLLQPLVENAIKHGLEPQRGGGELWVSAEQQGDTVLLWVRDSGRGLPPPANSPDAANDRQGSGGFGTQQVVNRLQTVYGDQAEFLLQPREGGGTQACICLPLNPSLRPSPSPRPTCPPP